MSYPDNFNSAACDDAFATTDEIEGPTSQDVMAVLAKNNPELTLTLTAAIEQILFAEYGSSARMDDSTQKNIADEFANNLAEAVGYMTEGADFSQYISEIE